jgi:hypothetical protein
VPPVALYLRVVAGPTSRHSFKASDLAQMESRLLDLLSQHSGPILTALHRSAPVRCVLDVIPLYLSCGEKSVTPPSGSTRARDAE